MEIVREQDILKREPPNGGVWSEENIRSYQEAKGVNYGSTVFCRGMKPNREWSNDRYFGNEPQVANPPEPVIDPRDAEIQALRDLIESMKSVPPAHTGVERHGLDKRTKEYKDAVGK